MSNGLAPEPSTKRQRVSDAANVVNPKTPAQRDPKEFLPVLDILMEMDGGKDAVFARLEELGDNEFTAACSRIQELESSKSNLTNTLSTRDAKITQLEATITENTQRIKALEANLRTKTAEAAHWMGRAEIYEGKRPILSNDQYPPLDDPCYLFSNLQRLSRPETTPGEKDQAWIDIRWSARRLADIMGIQRDRGYPTITMDEVQERLSKLETTEEVSGIPVATSSIVLGAGVSDHAAIIALLRGATTNDSTQSNLAAFLDGDWKKEAGPLLLSGLYAAIRLSSASQPGVVTRSRTQGGSIVVSKRVLYDVPLEWAEATGFSNNGFDLLRQKYESSVQAAAEGIIESFWGVVRAVDSGASDAYYVYALYPGDNSAEEPSKWILIGQEGPLRKALIRTLASSSQNFAIVGDGTKRNARVIELFPPSSTPDESPNSLVVALQTLLLVLPYTSSLYTMSVRDMQEVMAPTGFSRLRPTTKNDERVMRKRIVSFVMDELELAGRLRKVLLDGKVMVHNIDAVGCSWLDDGDKR